MGLEPTSLSTGGFQNRFLTNSGDLRKLCFKAPGTGIEPAAFWFRARRNYQQLLPRIRYSEGQRDVGSHFAKLGEEDSNLYHLIQSQVAYR